MFSNVNLFFQKPAVDRLGGGGQFYPIAHRKGIKSRLLWSPVTHVVTKEKNFHVLYLEYLEYISIVPVTQECRVQWLGDCTPSFSSIIYCSTRMIKFVLIFERKDTTDTFSSLNTAAYKINGKRKLSHNYPDTCPYFNAISKLFA